MRITERDVLYVAGLANLELTGEERLRMQRDLDSILGYVDLLNELDTQAVEPMAQIRFDTGDQSRLHANGYSAQDQVVLSGLRSDVPVASLSREAALRNAPATDGKFFKVPKVVER